MPPRPSAAPFHPDPDERRRYGRYYTPAPLVAAVHRLVREALAREGLDAAGCALIDPSCGPGAFLSAAEAAAYASRTGLDLDAAALEEARARAPGAELLCGDAYGEGLAAARERLRPGGRPVAVIGNPPYVANSALLKSGRYRAVRDSLLPFAGEVARGTSVRDDYVLFFGVADRLIEAGGGRGAIGFVTSASFVDNFLYAPMRRWLLSRYRLEALVELGAGLFEGTRVETAVSIWLRSDAGQQDRPFRHARLSGSVEQRLESLRGELPWREARPHGEALLLSAPDEAQARTVAAMRASGDPIGSIFRVSLPGLKTRFEQLLVAPTRAELERRMRAFFQAQGPERFAEQEQLPARTLEKLRQAFAARERTRFDPAAIRPFAQYAGPKHRFRVPDGAMAFAYVDPVLIPRGDHRFRGSYDPHRHGPKLVFNVREVPLVAAVVEGETCVHDYQHARFAPLYVPAAIAEGGLAAGRSQPRRQRDLFAQPQAGLALNLADPWREAVRVFEKAEDLLWYVSGVVNSRVVQERFAPLAGATEEVPVPRPTAASRALARRVAAAARRAEPGGELGAAANTAVERLFAV